MKGTTVRKRGPLVILSLGLVVLSTAPAMAAFPGANGRIVYTKATRQSTRTIFTIDPDGTDRTQVTTQG